MFSVKRDPLGTGGPMVSLPARRERTRRSAVVPEGPPQPRLPSLRGGAPSSAEDLATATTVKFHWLCARSGFSHIGKKMWSLCRNSHPKSAGGVVHSARAQLGGMRLFQPYPRIQSLMKASIRSIMLSELLFCDLIPPAFSQW